MRTIAMRFAVLALLASSSAFAGEPRQEGAPKDWQGRYRYEHAAGRTAGGTGIVVNYDLVLLPPDVRDGCVLTVRGFQSDEKIRCRTRRDGQGLEVAFDRYDDGSTVNKYGVAVYKPGQPLFTLVKETRLVTRWQGLRPDGEGVTESGSYFSKVK